MESFSEASLESYLNKETKSQVHHNDTLEAKMAELMKMKEAIKKAKERATQSWLDSRPLIDELERQKSSLEIARTRCSMSDTVILELESELETTGKSIGYKKEEEFKASTTVNEVTQALDQTLEEMERLKLDIDEEREGRVRLKQVMRLRRQTLRTLQLTLRAIRLESEAFRASEEDATRHINRSETDNTTVQLNQEDYYALTSRTKEESSLADWRISVAMEQRFTAEASQETALVRLKEIYSDRNSMKMKSEADKKNGDGDSIREDDSRIKTRGEGRSRQSPFPKARPDLMAEPNRTNPQQTFKRLRSNSNGKIIKKKKPSIFFQIKSFLVSFRTRLFG